MRFIEPEDSRSSPQHPPRSPIFSLQNTVHAFLTGFLKKHCHHHHHHHQQQQQQPSIYA
jgi:hypothetical protein